MARDGRYEQAVANQALGFRIAQHGADQPQLIAYLVSVASETIALSGMADILAEAGPNAATADAVRRAISAGLPNRTLAGALKGEALCGGTLIRMSPSVRDTMPSDPDGPPPVILYTKPNAFARWWWNDPAEAIYLHWMTRMIQAAETPVEGRTAAMSKVAEDIKRASGGQPAYVLTSMLVPTFSRACERDAQTAARRMVISSAAAVLAYRARHGVYPVTLEQAVSPAPVDPLTGRPLEYTATKTGFLVAAHPDATGLDAKKARSLTESLQFRYPRDEG